MINLTIRLRESEWGKCKDRVDEYVYDHVEWEAEWAVRDQLENLVDQVWWYIKDNVK